MKIRPLHDRILVKRLEEDAKTKGGIIIPDSAKEKPQEGKVIAVGEGAARQAHDRDGVAGVHVHDLAVDLPGLLDLVHLEVPVRLQDLLDHDAEPT